MFCVQSDADGTGPCGTRSALIHAWLPSTPRARPQVLGAMPLGGLPYTHVTAYIVIRTAVNVGAQDKAEYYASAMVQRQVRVWGGTRVLQRG